ncbi:coiled coil domain-containing protein [Aliiroseovarius sp. S1339]|uniref:coiled coil domain-containing protein n=1 Tax=Aliiroseovarius sp. S1339 TaxID=2936990 RepID=UPI0020BF1031|nr:coiled coil domain-containing protein [Aliiroseovarius sp. S1339]MCK8465533.1 coiled coil domain-containing protein [Aliiroseovarius sp. S1339]
MDKKEDYQDKLQAQLDEWNAEIAKLRAKAEEAQAAARVKYLEEVEELRGHQKKAEERLKELAHAQGEAWKDMKTGVEAAWDEMGDAMKRAWKRFS